MIAEARAELWHGRIQTCSYEFLHSASECQAGSGLEAAKVRHSADFDFKSDKYDNLFVYTCILTPYYTHLTLVLYILLNFSTSHGRVKVNLTTFTFPHPIQFNSINAFPTHTACTIKSQKKLQMSRNLEIRHAHQQSIVLFGPLHKSG